MFWQLQSVRHVQLMIGGEQNFFLDSYDRDSLIIINFSSTEYEAYCIRYEFDLII